MGSCCSERNSKSKEKKIPKKIERLKEEEREEMERSKKIERLKEEEREEMERLKDIERLKEEEREEMERLKDIERLKEMENKNEKKSRKKKINNVFEKNKFLNEKNNIKKEEEIKIYLLNKVFIK